MTTAPTDNSSALARPFLCGESFRDVLARRSIEGVDEGFQSALSQTMIDIDTKHRAWGCKRNSKGKLPKEQHHGHNQDPATTASGSPVGSPTEARDAWKG
jgi:hypothetical protein